MQETKMETTTVIPQTQKPLNVLPVLYEKTGIIAASYDPGQEISQLLSMLKEDETSGTYQKAAEKTWVLFKRVVMLVLFTFSLIVALLIWLYGMGFQAGFYFRRWLEVERPPIEKVTSLILNYLSLPFRKAYDWANWFVKEYLHWQISFDSANSQSPKSTSTETKPETKL